QFDKGKTLLHLSFHMSLLEIVGRPRRPDFPPAACVPTTAQRDSKPFHTAALQAFSHTTAFSQCSNQVSHYRITADITFQDQPVTDIFWHPSCGNLAGRRKPVIRQALKE